jgi:hypothetical protein
MDDDEHFWEAVDYCWSIRRRVDGPGSGDDACRGPGVGRGAGTPRNPAVHHYRLAAGHLVEMLTV